mmetsp:Transcript_45713/g.87404  ORF Transcript_45713/g.87404 Transcript_45713/m.87404 type:complete len:84 (+) Transcript_45713:333-584(+)
MHPTCQAPFSTDLMLVHMKITTVAHQYRAFALARQTSHPVAYAGNMLQQHDVAPMWMPHAAFPVWSFCGLLTTLLAWCMIAGV